MGVTAIPCFWLRIADFGQNLTISARNSKNSLFFSLLQGIFEIREERSQPQFGLLDRGLSISLRLRLVLQDA
jgi:hypothetical protein